MNPKPTFWKVLTDFRKLVMSFFKITFLFQNLDFSKSYNFLLIEDLMFLKYIKKRVLQSLNGFKMYLIQD